MEVNIKIDCGAKPLDEGHRAGVDLGTGQSGLVDQLQVRANVLPYPFPTHNQIIWSKSLVKKNKRYPPQADGVFRGSAIYFETPRIL